MKCDCQYLIQCLDADVSLLRLCKTLESLPNFPIYNLQLKLVIVNLFSVPILHAFTLVCITFRMLQLIQSRLQEEHSLQDVIFKSAFKSASTALPPR